jgi:hypothetical protein
MSERFKEYLSEDHRLGVEGQGLYHIEINQKCGVFSTRADSIIVPIEWDGTQLLDGNGVLWGVERSGKWGIFSTLTQSLVVPVRYDCLLNVDYRFLEIRENLLVGILSLPTLSIVVPVEFCSVMAVKGDYTKHKPGTGTYWRVTQNLPNLHDHGRVGTFFTGTGEVEWERDW